MVSYHSLLVLWVCFFSIVSCSSDDIIDQYGSRLVQISTTTTDNYEERTNLHYDQTGKVLTVEDFAQNLKFYIEYKDDKILKHTSHYFHTPNSINAIDSFIYDQNGKLDKVNLYRRLSLALKLSFEIDYIYDGHDMPSERKTIFLGSGKIVSAQKFFWRNNNLLKIQYFNHENNMEGETEFHITHNFYVTFLCFLFKK
ncbi:MAG: hypothetical protein IPK35_11985 [Saprospiraceae bacterium]|nr:hypothetical protein [Saprospiraceae bacterium]